MNINFTKPLLWIFGFSALALLLTLFSLNSSEPTSNPIPSPKEGIVGGVVTEQKLWTKTDAGVQETPPPRQALEDRGGAKGNISYLMCNGKAWSSCPVGQQFYCPPNIGDAKCITNQTTNFGLDAGIESLISNYLTSYYSALVLQEIETAQILQNILLNELNRVQSQIRQAVEGMEAVRRQPGELSEIAERRAQIFERYVIRPLLQQEQSLREQLQQTSKIRSKEYSEKRAGISVEWNAAMTEHEESGCLKAEGWQGDKCNDLRKRISEINFRQSNLMLEHNLVPPSMGDAYLKTFSFGGSSFELIPDSLGSGRGSIRASDGRLYQYSCNIGALSTVRCFVY